MITYNSNLMGEITARNKDNTTYKVQIRQGNCLAVMITTTKLENGLYQHSLWSFFMDENHLRRVAKNHGGDPLCGNNDIKSVKLNLAFKESNTLLKYIVKAGYKVNCYYKEPKATKK